MYHFGHLVAKVLDGEIDSALVAAEVIVDAHATKHKQRSGDSLQPEACGQILLEEILYLLYALFRLLGIKQRSVGRNAIYFTHDV